MQQCEGLGVLGRFRTSGVAAGWLVDVGAADVAPQLGAGPWGPGGDRDTETTHCICWRVRGWRFGGRWTWGPWGEGASSHGMQKAALTVGP